MLSESSLPLVRGQLRTRALGNGQRATGNVAHGQRWHSTRCTRALHVARWHSTKCTREVKAAAATTNALERQLSWRRVPRSR